jgi:hypothetical protein
MNDQNYYKTLIIIVVIGLVFTAGHAIYICHAYSNSSIIQFVSGELW